MRVAIAIALGLACGPGCDRVFGLEHIPPDVRVGPDEVTGHLTRLWVGNAEDNTSSVHDDVFATERIAIRVAIGDGEPQPVALDARGDFAFATTQPYRLVIQIDAESPTQYDSTARHLEIASKHVGRLDRVPVEPGSIKVSGDKLPAETTILRSSGLWTATSPATTLATYSLDWSTAVGNGPVGLLEASQGDLLYATNYSLDPAGNVVLSSWSTFTGGMTPGVDIAMPAPTLARGSLTSHLFAQRLDELTRITQAFPSLTNHHATGWYLLSTPAAVVTIDGLTTLAYHEEYDGTTPNTDVTLAYDNPVPGSVLAFMQVTTTFDSGFPQLPFKPSIASSVYVPVTDTVRLDAGNAALPTTATFAGTLLDRRGLIVPIDRARPIHVTWAIASEGPRDGFIVYVREVEGAQALTTLYTVITEGTSTDLPATLFIPGHPYVLEVHAVRGLPNLAMGDSSTIKYPYALGETMTHVFQVMP